MSPYGKHPRQAGSHQQAGFGLIELMVAMAIALFMTLVLASVYLGMKKSYSSQDQMSQLQDAERLATLVLTNSIQSAGYFTDPVNKALVDALPASAVANPDATKFLAAGQRVTGTKGGATSSDTINIRYQTATGDGIMNCLGGSNATGADIVYINSFSVNASRQLQCSVNGAAAVALVDNVVSLRILYNVDTGGNGTPDTYMDATAVTAAGLWSSVYSVQLSIVFVDTVNSTATNTVSLPNPWVQNVKLMSLI